MKAYLAIIKLNENPTFIVKKLNAAIDDDLDTSTAKEIDFSISGGARSEYLQLAYSYLEINFPTRADCERFVSAVAYVNDRIYSRAFDD